MSHLSIHKRARANGVINCNALYRDIIYFKLFKLISNY